MKPTIKDIELAVCLNFNLTWEIIRGPSRARKYARPRQIAMALARELTGLSLPQIGRHFCRDHTTVIAARTRINELVAANPKVAAHVQDCRDMLANVLAHKAIRNADYLSRPLVELRAA